MKRIKQLEVIYKSDFHRDFREMLKYCAKKYGSSKAFIIKHKLGKDISYENISFEDLKNQVNWVGTAMMELNLAGKRVAVIGKNRYEWFLGYFATLCGIGVCIPLDRALPEEEAVSSLNRSYADVLIFDKEQLPLVENIRKNSSTGVSTFICMEPIEGYTSLPELRDRGKALMNGGDTSYLDQPVENMEPTIVLFTSGTTSMSKAVMLSQHNITSNIHSMLKCEDFRHGDVNMAFLPYHHTFGATGQLVMLAAGVTTAFCDGLKYVQKNIVEYKVSIFVCVPILIEAIYKKIMLGIKKQGKEAKFKKGLKLAAALEKVGIKARRKIFKEILDQLGGDLRYIISGASALDPEAHKGLNNIGILAVQGYGMTEASPVLAAENPKHQSRGSIGLAMPDVELALDEVDEDGVGEIIARGPNIMAGYFENKEETDKILVDGWLHTGDLAYLDKGGYIHICGRKKNVIVLKNGKNIYPEELEVSIANLPYVAESMVYGDVRGDEQGEATVLAAKIVYKPEVMEELLPNSTKKEIEEFIQKDIDKINADIPKYKNIIRLIVTDEPMIKTTTGKVKRFEEIKRIKAESGQ